MCCFQMEMSPIQVSFQLGKCRLSYILNFYFMYTKREHLALYSLLQLGRKKRNSEGSVGIVAISNLSCGWGVAGWHLSKAGENALNLQHMCLFDIHRRAGTLQLALFALFSKMRGLNSWSKLKKSTTEVKLHFKYLITNPCSKVLIRKMLFLNV